MDEKVHTWLGIRKGRLEGLLSKKGEGIAAEYKEGSDGEGGDKGVKKWPLFEKSLDRDLHIENF